MEITAFRYCYIWYTMITIILAIIFVVNITQFKKLETYTLINVEDLKREQLIPEEKEDVKKQLVKEQAKESAKEDAKDPVEEVKEEDKAE